MIVVLLRLLDLIRRLSCNRFIVVKNLELKWDVLYYLEMAISDSQNFINNRKLVEILANLISKDRANIVLEIGPGKGIITKELLKEYKNIIAIEVDHKLSANLKEKFKNDRNVCIVTENFLEYKTPKVEFDVFANIPFNITADIIKKITSENSNLHKAYLVVQKESAEKIVGSSLVGFSLLSNLIKVRFNTKILRNINRFNFSPRPKVDASFLYIGKRRSKIFRTIDEENLFKDFITYVYNRPSPFLADALKSIFSNKQIDIAFKNKNIPSTIKVKQAEFFIWIYLFNIFLSQTPERMKLKVIDKYKDLIKGQSLLKKINRTRKY